MKSKRQHAGLTVVELLLALVIMATLMTAVAVAFDASVKNYNANKAIYKALNTARAALLRITNDVRTAQAVAVDEGGADPDTQCSLNTSGGADYTYRLDAGTHTLYLDDNTAGQSYALCKNVTALTFKRGTVPGDDTRIRSVRISITVTDDNGRMPQTLAAAAIVRRNL